MYWGLENKLVKNGTRILVAKDLSVINFHTEIPTAVMHVRIPVCVCLCTRPPLGHRAPLCTLGKGAPSEQKQPQCTLLGKQTVGWTWTLFALSGLCGSKQRWMWPHIDFLSLRRVRMPLAEVWQSHCEVETPQLESPWDAWKYLLSKSHFYKTHSCALLAQPPSWR